MKISSLFLLFFVSFLASFLRFYLNNFFVVSLLGSFLFGLVIEKKLSKTVNQIILTGFCSCFTSFSGFIKYSYELINNENFIIIFIYLNLIIILNLFIMNCGCIISRKIT